MTRKRKIIFGMVVAATLLIASLLLYLAISDLSGWSDTAARIASDAIDREITIAGEFEVDLGIVTRVRATELSLANTDWGSEPSMARVDRLDAEINLRELIVKTLDSTGDPDGMHQLTGGGSLRGADFTLSGGFGSFAELINLKPFDHDLRGTLGSTEFRSSGSIGRIAELGDLAVKAEATIPNPTEIYRFLGLSYTFSRPLTIKADATTTSGMTDFTLTGVDDLPAVPFRVQGDTTVTGAGFRLGKITGRVDDIDLAADGLVTKEKGLTGTTLAIEAAGSDLSRINTLVPTLNLPAESFRVKGDLEILATGIGLRGVEVAVGSATGTLDGTIGSPPEFEDTTFQVQANGPSLAVADDLVVGVSLPAAEFTISGSASMRGDAIDLDEVVFGLAGNTLRIDGTLVPGDGLIGSEVQASIEGGNLDDFARLVATSLATEIPTLPERAFSVDGAVAVDEVGFHFSRLDLSLGKATTSITGVVGRWPDFYGSDIEVVADGPDASLISAAAGITVPIAPFELTGRISN